MSNGLDKILESYSVALLNSTILAEGIGWDQVKREGVPASVRTDRNMYGGYVIDGLFYYLGPKEEVFQVPVNKISPSGLQYHTRINPAKGEETSIKEAWIGAETKHRLLKATQRSLLDAAVQAFLKLQSKDRLGPKRPLMVASELIGIDPRVLSIELQQRDIKEGNAENKAKRPDRGKARLLKPTNTLNVHNVLGKSGYKIVDQHFISNGSVSLIRDNNGDAYEVTVKPSYLGSYFQKERGLNENIYPGNIGLVEVTKFYRAATPEQIREFEQHVEAGNDNQAWDLVVAVVGDDPRPGFNEGYSVMPGIDRERYTDIPGLEGPFVFGTGRVLYYDAIEGKYYDRDTDMYLSNEEFDSLSARKT